MNKDGPITRAGLKYIGPLMSVYRDPNDLLPTLEDLVAENESVTVATVRDAALRCLQASFLGRSTTKPRIVAAAVEFILATESLGQHIESTYDAKEGAFHKQDNGE